MQETEIQTAVNNLIRDPCPELKERILGLVAQSPDSYRTLAISALESFLQNNAGRKYAPLVDTLVTLRRVSG